MSKPIDPSFIHRNADVLLGVGQLELMVGLSVLFAFVSLVIWRVRGRGISYFISQFLSLAFVILTVSVLFERVASARVAHHMLVEYGMGDQRYPELVGQTHHTPR